MEWDVRFILIGLILGFSASPAFAEWIQPGDLLISRVPLSGNPPIFETTTFAAGDTRPAQDRCEMKAGLENGRSLPEKFIFAEMKTETPEFDLIGFLEGVRSESEKIFNALVDVDEYTGLHFKREDLPDQLRMTFQSESLRKLPSAMEGMVKAFFEAHLRGYWAEVSKSSNRKSANQMKDFLLERRQQWIAKLEQEVRWALRSEAKKQKLLSDRLTRTTVEISFRSPSDGSLPTLFRCAFDGDREQVSLERVNAVLSPYLEVMSSAAWENERKKASSHLNESGQRGLAVDGQAISP